MFQLKHLRAIGAFIMSLSAISCGPPGSGRSFESVGLVESTIQPSAEHQVRLLSAQKGEDAKATVILVHGTPGSADGWVDMLAQTPSQVHAIAYDRLGYGKTRPKGSVISLARHAQTVIDIAELAAEDRPVVIAGHSYGGPVVAKAALMRPDLFRAVILAAAAMDPGLEEVHWAQRLATYQPLKFMIGRTLRTANEELIGLEAELVALERELPDMTVPIYIIHGSADDLVPIENLPFMKKHLPAEQVCAVTVIEDQNHFLPWNEIEAFWAMALKAAEDEPGRC